MYDFLNVEKYENLPLEQVRAALKSREMLDRNEVLEFLIEFAEESEIQKIAVDMLVDKNYVVRCSAYEILMFSSSKQILEIIIDKLEKEINRITRMYAASTICSIIKNGVEIEKEIFDKIQTLFNNERSSCVIIAYHSVFYLINKDITHVKEILKFLNNKSYHIRCNAIHISMDIINENNKQLIIDSFKKRYDIEETESVKSTLLSAIED